MDKWVVLNNQTTGRDKLARSIQYFSRALWYSFEENDYSTALINQFKTIECILSSFRKLLRFGKCLDVFYSTLKTIHYPDLTIRITLTFSKLSQAIFLLSDHILWLSRTGLFQNIDSKKWSDISNKYWLLAIMMNLARDVYEIFHLINLHKLRKNASKNISRINLTSSSSQLPTSFSCLNKSELRQLVLYSYRYLYEHRDVAVDTIKNICDIFIPLTALGYTKLTPRTIGILGVTSSIADLIAVWEPNTRLVPM